MKSFHHSNFEKNKYFPSLKRDIGSLVASCCSLAVGRSVLSIREVRVITESEHQKGMVIPLCKLFKGRVSNFPEFLTEDFCDAAFNFSYRLSFFSLL